MENEAIKVGEGTFEIDEDRMGYRMLENAYKIAHSGVGMFIERMGTHPAEFEEMDEGSHGHYIKYLKHKPSDLMVYLGTPWFGTIYFKNPNVTFGWKRGWEFKRALKEWRRWESFTDAREAARDIKRKMTEAIEIMKGGE